MPYTATNTLYLRGPDAVVGAFLPTLAGPAGPVDFNTIIPYPPQERLASTERAQWVRGLSTALNNAGIEVYRSPFWTLQPKCTLTEENSARYAAVVADYTATWGEEPEGQPGWGWYACHWGTRCNAEMCSNGWFIEPEAECGLASAQITFETIWGPPMPILDEIAARLPAGVEMRVRVYSEYDESIVLYEVRDGELGILEVEPRPE